MTDDELRERMEASLIASWAALAERVPGARLAGRAAIFPTGPQRAIYNNALAGPGGARIGAAVAAYAAAGVERFAVWVREGDDEAAAVAADHGLALDETTRAMAIDLAELELDPPALDPGGADPEAVLALNGLPAGLLAGAPFGVAVARLDDRPAAGLMWLDHAGDRTIFNVATAPHARRRGLAGALTAAALLDARAAGCATASLQASPMAEGVYRRLGLRDLGRFLEHAPARG